MSVAKEGGVKVCDGYFCISVKVICVDMCSQTQSRAGSSRVWTSVQVGLPS